MALAAKLKGKGANPLPAYKFVVDVEGVEGFFVECSGLTIERETEDYAEGGLNTYVHKLPGRIKYHDLTLRHGIFPNHTEIWDWFKAGINEGTPFKVLRKKVTITLYDFATSDSKPSAGRVWVFEGAYPTRWEGPRLATNSNDIAFQIITIAHKGLSTV
jgi:phage tail-like protein